MNTFKTKNSLRTIEAQIVQKLKNNEARPKFTGSYKKKSVYTIRDRRTQYIVLVSLVAFTLRLQQARILVTVPKPHQITQNNTKRWKINELHSFSYSKQTE